MVKTAFCDDDPSVLNELQVLLDRYCAERNQEITHTAFRSPIDLLEAIERGARFDVLFLDVLIREETGSMRLPRFAAVTEMSRSSS